MNGEESSREYTARSKGLARAVRRYNVEVVDEGICRRMSNDLPSAYDFVQGFVFQCRLSFKNLEHGRAKAEDPNKQSDGADGSHAQAFGFKSRGGRKRERGGGRGGRGLRVRELRERLQCIRLS